MARLPLRTPSTPVVQGGVVYLQDLNSNVYALEQTTGKLKWKHRFDSPSIGPNGVSVGYGHVYGATEKSVFALDPSTGALVWKKAIAPNIHVCINMAPQLYDDKVLISTVPGSSVKHFYEAGAVGIVWALDASTGKTIWKFDTFPPVANGNISGGGLCLLTQEPTGRDEFEVRATIETRVLRMRAKSVWQKLKPVVICFPKWRGHSIWRKFSSPGQLT